MLINFATLLVITLSIFFVFRVPLFDRRSVMVQRMWILSLYGGLMALALMFDRHILNNPQMWYASVYVLNILSSVLVYLSDFEALLTFDKETKENVDKLAAVTSAIIIISLLIQLIVYGSQFLSTSR